jgi:hypothetical protein
MERIISPHLMRRRAGRGPHGKVCAECISYEEDDAEYEGLCIHQERPFNPFYVERLFPACGLFRSECQYERELLEAQGQLRLGMCSRVKKERHFYDLPPGAEMADQDWTTPGFWPRTQGSSAAVRPQKGSDANLNRLTSAASVSANPNEVRVQGGATGENL